MNNLPNISFKFMRLNKLTFSEWLKEYKHDIRIGIKWENVRKPKVGIRLAIEEDELYAPWYRRESKRIRGCNWMQGKPDLYRKGNNLIITRVPAILLSHSSYTERSKNGKSFFLPDGNHRVSELKPAMIILDYLELQDNDFRFIVDLHNEYFENIWKKK